MKPFFLGIIFVLGSASQNSMALFCLSGESTYQVFLSDDETSAKVLKNFESTRFGELICKPTSNLPNYPDIVLWCNSRNVADAGFVAKFRGDQNKKIQSVQISELFLAGAKTIADLPCLNEMGSLENRILWTHGELDLEGLTVSAGGEIEVNIKTQGGGDSIWELQNSTPSDAVSLVTPPLFISTTETPGDLGVTRFRFRVNPVSSTEFTLFFQLRRSGEDAPVKRFELKVRVVPSRVGD